MSKLVAFAAIQGAYNIVAKAEGKYKKALETFGGSQKLEFPNTAYFLPIIYGGDGHVDDLKGSLGCMLIEQEFQLATEPIGRVGVAEGRRSPQPEVSEHPGAHPRSGRELRDRDPIEPRAVRLSFPWGSPETCSTT